MSNYNRPQFNFVYNQGGMSGQKRLEHLGLKPVPKPVSATPLQKLDSRVSEDKHFAQSVMEKYNQPLNLQQRVGSAWNLQQPQQPPRREEGELMIINKQVQVEIPVQSLFIRPKSPPKDIVIDLFAKSSSSSKMKQEKMDKYVWNGSFSKNTARPMQAAVGVQQQQQNTKRTHIKDCSNMTPEQCKQLVQSVTGHVPRERKKPQNSDEKRLQEFEKRFRDRREREEGYRTEMEFLEENRPIQSSVKIQKRTEVSSSKRLNTYNQLLQQERMNSSMLGQQKKAVLEFSLLLKFLFLRSYHENEQDDTEHKVIPNKFASAEEYHKIFEYLLLNECWAQTQQELVRFIRDKKVKWRRLQARVDEGSQDKDGLILQVRGQVFNKQLEERTVVIDEEEGDEDRKKKQEQERDGNCDLMVLKNYIIIIAKGLDIDLKKFNKPLTEKDAFVFGWLLDPQKAQWLHQLRVLTFSDQHSYFRDWQDIVLLPFAKVSTFIREYMMIKHLDTIDLAPVIYDPNKQRPLISDDVNDAFRIATDNIIAHPHLLKQYFESVQPHYNPSQFRCIREISLIDRGICLLQGPPGTGKTHTLVGLVSTIYNYMMKLGTLGRKKILICAPSNAAIDEVLLRVVNGGVKNEYDQPIKVKALRIGPIDTSSDSHDIQEIKKYSLEDLAQKSLFDDQVSQNNLDQKTTADIKSELAKLQLQINKLSKKQPQDYNELDRLHHQRRRLMVYLDQLKGAKKMQKEKYQKQLEELLNKSEIICTTLASSGSDKLDRFKDQIDVLIIDEAAQCTEPNNIIPLRLGVRKMILVGDPKQLPATTFSPVSNQTLYNRSLFERIISNNFKPYFLSIQYRMHPSIRMFPSRYFYNNQLTDHPSILDRKVYSEVTLIDCPYARETKADNSYKNQQECNIVVELLHQLRLKHPELTIGVICGYKSQTKFIKQAFKQEHPALFDKSVVSVNTIDSFQGQEKDVIIFSCVRANEARVVGFMNDQRRINVALTRARNALIVVASCSTMSADPCWKDYINEMLLRSLYFHIPAEDKAAPVIERFIHSRMVESELKQPTQQLSRYLQLESKGKKRREEFNLDDFKEDKQSKTEEQMRVKKHHKELDRFLKRETDSRRKDKPITISSEKKLEPSQSQSQVQEITDFLINNQEQRQPSPPTPDLQIDSLDDLIKLIQS